LPSPVNPCIFRGRIEAETKAIYIEEYPSRSAPDASAREAREIGVILEHSVVLENRKLLLFWVSLLASHPATIEGQYNFRRAVHSWHRIREEPAVSQAFPSSRIMSVIGEGGGRKQDRFIIRPIFTEQMVILN
jgi:hypothetical protein